MSKSSKKNQKQNGQNANGKRKTRRRRVTWISIGVVAVLLGAAIAATTANFNNNVNDQPGGITGLIRSAVGTIVGKSGVENILLIGNNARNPSSPIGLGDGGGQADIMMVAHVDPTKHLMVLITIPRNVLFAQPQYNDPIPKLKTLFFIGAQMQPNQAAQLTMQGVAQLTGLKITHYVVTDFQGFVDAINAVGGIRVNVPGRLYDPANSGANLYPGWQTLNGEQALAFIRIRQNQASNSIRVNDFQRMDAEAQMIDALKQKLLSPGGDLSHLPALISTWQKDVVTNMSTPSLFQLANDASGAKVIHLTIGKIGDSMQLTSTALPGINQENYITGAYYDIISTNDVYKMLKPYGSKGSSTGLPQLPAPSSVIVQVYGAQSYADRLKAAGFQVQWMGPGNGTYPVQIDYPTGNPAWGWQVGRYLATGNSMVSPGSPNANAVVVYG